MKTRPSARASTSEWAECGRAWERKVREGGREGGREWRVHPYVLQAVAQHGTIEAQEKVKFIDDQQMTTGRYVHNALLGNTTLHPRM